MKVKTREKGTLELYAVTESPEGRWEIGWENLRATLLGKLITRMPRSAFNHVLNGFSQPFVAALGLPPDGALKKLARPGCAKQDLCPLHDPRTCSVRSNKLPWCFEPEELSEFGEPTRRIAAELIFLWKEGVYVIAVYDDA